MQPFQIGQNSHIIPSSLSQFWRCCRTSSQRSLWILFSVRPSLPSHRSGSIGCSWGKTSNDMHLITTIQPDWLCNWPLNHVFYFRFYLFISLEEGKGRKRGRETSMCGCLSHAPKWGPGPPATQARALTGNQTGNPLVRRSVLSPLSHTNQG